MIRILQTNVKNYIWFSRSRTYINKVAHCGFQKAVTVVREGNFMNAVVRCVILGTMTFREPPTWPWAGLKRQPSQGTDVICAEFGRTPVTSPYDVFFQAPTNQPTNQLINQPSKSGKKDGPGVQARRHIRAGASSLRGTRSHQTTGQPAKRILIGPILVFFSSFFLARCISDLCGGRRRRCGRGGSGRASAECQSRCSPSRPSQTSQQIRSSKRGSSSKTFTTEGRVEAKRR